jgi:hypothetical protein
MSDTFIFAHDVSFNYPLTNIRDILPVYTTDTILNITCTKLDVSGSLTANNMSCTNANINNIYTSNSSYVSINKPLKPTYTYNATTGTNVINTNGYIYSSTIAATTITPGTTTTLVSNLNVSAGIYLLKYTIQIKNTGNNTATNVIKMKYMTNRDNTVYRLLVFTALDEIITHTFSYPMFILNGELINIYLYIPEWFNNNTTYYKSVQISGKIEYLKIG